MATSTFNKEPPRLACWRRPRARRDLVSETVTVARKANFESSKKHEDAELEERKNDKAYRRLSKRFEKEDSPSEDDDAPIVPPTTMDTDPKDPMVRL